MGGYVGIYGDFIGVYRTQIIGQKVPNTTNIIVVGPDTLNPKPSTDFGVRNSLGWVVIVNIAS